MLNKDTKTATAFMFIAVPNIQLLKMNRMKIFARVLLGTLSFEYVELKGCHRMCE